MMLDLIEVKVNNKKFGILFACVVVVIAISVIAGIYLAGYQHEKQNREEDLCLAKKNFIHRVNFPMPQIDIEKLKNGIQTIYKSEQKRVFLTFDDGPSKTVTPLILDLLKQENIKANFFVLGSRVEFYPDIVKRAYEERHFIGNHGYSHKYNRIYETPQKVLEEYYATESLIKKAIGDEKYESHLMRLPGGTSGGKYAEVKRQAIELLNQNQICHVDWNALTSDSAGSYTKEAMLESVKNTIGTKSSVVILMHDAGDKILTYEILPDLICFLREQGYTFETFYDLMK